ncbi:hypothetical protein AAFP35_00660 [Gordonia sp. CPCC 206044]|uniref:hypothetical protein n=1 Tax=Gordonia sp. CPCC 206044 TaxID=3140793 RepID=UPI003AF3398E
MASGVETEEQVVFPLRRPRVAELGGPGFGRAQRELLRHLSVPLPELCVPHGRSGGLARVYTYWARGWHFSRPMWKRVLLLCIPFYTLSVRLHERRYGEPRVRFRMVGCSQCRRTLNRYRLRTVLIVVLALSMFFVVPRFVWSDNETLGAFLVIFGWTVPVMVNLVVLKRFPEYFTRAFVSDDGRELIISRPHPDYARAAVEAGAEYRADGPKVPRDNWFF